MANNNKTKKDIVDIELFGGRYIRGDSPLLAFVGNHISGEKLWFVA
jgi:hypothetical protein